MKTLKVMSTSAATVVLLLASTQSFGQGGVRETADVVGQGPMGPVVSMDGASVVRTDNGLTVAIKLPTPAPGSYDYPAGTAFQPEVFQGAPEVFTGWAFIFNYPELCSDPCDSNDLGLATGALGGVYNFAGHVVGGDTLRFVGHVSNGDTTWAHAPLENPMGAEIHLAVAPHGTLQPDLMPIQITTPTGSPPYWWIAVFQPSSP